MSTGIKEDAIRLVQSLPDDSDWDDLMRAIYERIIVDRSREDFRQGRVMSSDEARQRFLRHG